LGIQVLLQGAFAFIKILFHGNRTGRSSVIFGETLASPYWETNEKISGIYLKSIYILCDEMT
jgi:hypothetical protein